MTEWLILLTPVLVLPIVLLFRFVGCAEIAGLGDPAPSEPPSKTVPGPGLVAGPPAETPPVQPPTTPPNYRKYILGDPVNPGLVKHPAVKPDKANVVGYWRLVDLPSDTVAKDENGFRNGQYVQGTALDNVDPQPTPPLSAKGGSQAATGDILTSQPGLIKTDPAALGRYFNGGYVRVPYLAGLFTEDFTIEAWVFPHAFTPNYEHTLFQAGGKYAIPPAGSQDHGFRVFENRFGQWQIRMAPAATDLFQSPPAVPRGAATHLAISVASEPAPVGAKKVTLYVDGKVTQVAIANAYSLPLNADLYIGVENAAAPAAAVQARTPILGRVQEVVIHRKALAQDEIENHVDINR